MSTLLRVIYLYFNIFKHERNDFKWILSQKQKQKKNTKKTCSLKSPLSNLLPKKYMWWQGYLTLPIWYLYRCTMWIVVKLGRNDQISSVSKTNLNNILLNKKNQTLYQKNNICTAHFNISIAVSWTVSINKFK